MPLNIANLDRVIAAIEAEEVAGQKFRFDMDGWLDDTPCGTTACIAGTALILAFPGTKFEDWPTGATGIFHEARVYLGLTSEEAGELFMPGGIGEGRYSRPQALACLRHLRRTGRVDWDAAEQLAEGVE